MKETKLYSANGSPIVAYKWEDIAFCNTELFLETRRHYEKYGEYCSAHPESLEFKEFWDREEDRRLNGMTAPGKLIRNPDGSLTIQEVHITGAHYDYLNYGQIKLTKDNQEVLLGKGDENVLKTRVGQKLISFPDFWDGDYHYYKALDLAARKGNHVCVSKARRKGYSYKNGHVAARKANLFKRSTTIIGAYDKRFLTQGDATTVMTKNYLDFYEDFTDFNRGYITEALENIELGYIRQGEGRKKRGYRSKILSVSFMDNPNAAVGKDADLILIEEAGVFPNILQMLGVTLPTMEDGDYVTGMLIMFGTGGTKEANWSGFESVFYNPHLYNMLPFVNVWDDEANNTACGFFHGYDLNYVPFVDKDGNSDRANATDLILKRRKAKKDISGGTEDYFLYVGQRCLKPAEAFGGSSVSIFDSDELREHIARVSHDDKLKYIAEVGKVFRINNEAVFTRTESLDPADRHPPLLDRFYETKDLTGAYIEWARPYKIEGKVPDNLYRIWVDPYAFAKEKGDITLRDSLGAAYVYERTNNLPNSGGGDRLVAARVGRPSDPDDFHEELLAICLRWNAQVQFESDRGDLKHYFKKAGYYHKLADEPDFDWKRELQGSKTPLGKGISINKGSDRKGNAALLLKQWLYTERGINELTGKPLYTFHYIFDVGLLKELQKWNLKGNFDRVSALLVGMLDKHEVFHKALEPVTKTIADDFFNRILF